MPTGSFAAQQGDQEAWRALFDECYPKVLRVIRRKLDRQSPLRSLYDSADFANDVWKSLAAKSGRFDFPSIQALMSFLRQAAEQKLIDERRRFQTQKRDIDRERRLETMTVGDEPYHLASGDPTPSQWAQEGETQQWLLANCSPEERRVIELRKQNYTNEEIAAQTGWQRPPGAAVPQEPPGAARFLADLRFGEERMTQTAGKPARLHEGAGPVDPEGRAMGQLDRVRPGLRGGMPAWSGAAAGTLLGRAWPGGAAAGALRPGQGRAPGPLRTGEKPTVAEYLDLFPQLRDRRRPGRQPRL